MINIRYHIISITAVFLALGLGLALGTSFGNTVLLNNLKNTQHTLDREVRDKRARNTELEQQLAQQNDRERKFIDAAVHTTLMSGRLTEVPVLVLAPKGIDDTYLNTLRTAIVNSGAKFAGTLRFDARLSLTGDNAARLQQILGETSTDPATTRTAAVRALSLVLSADGAKPGGTAATTTTTAVPTTLPGDGTLPGDTTTTVVTAPPVTVPPPTEPSLITELRTAGFLQFEPPSGTSTAALAMSGGGFRYVFFSGPGPDLPDSDFLLPLVKAMASSDNAPVVVASAATGADPEKVRNLVVGAIRNDSSISGRVSTVDDLESYAGVAATILALGDVGAGRHGHYGVGQGASAPLPPVTGGP